LYTDCTPCHQLMRLGRVVLYSSVQLFTTWSQPGLSCFYRNLMVVSTIRLCYGLLWCVVVCYSVLGWVTGCYGIWCNCTVVVSAPHLKCTTSPLPQITPSMINWPHAHVFGSCPHVHAPISLKFNMGIDNCAPDLFSFPFCFSLFPQIPPSMRNGPHTCISGSCMHGGG
jgi:hypothetical protein